MKSFESPCASTHDAPLKRRLGPAEPSAPPTEHQMVPDSSHGLLRRLDTENPGGGRMITFCLWQIRRNPLRDTSASPALLGDEGGGVPLSIISGRRSPDDELCREGSRSELQGKVSVKTSQI